MTRALRGLIRVNRAIALLTMVTLRGLPVVPMGIEPNCSTARAVTGARNCSRCGGAQVGSAIARMGTRSLGGLRPYARGRRYFFPGPPGRAPPPPAGEPPATFDFLSPECPWK